MSSFAGKVLQLSGGRELVDATKAQALVQEWLASNTVDGITKLALTNKSFTSEAAQEVAGLLSSLPSDLVIADISDIIAGRPEEDALLTLRIICDALSKFVLREVNLSDNALGAKGVEACRPVLVGKAIENLYLCNDGLSKEACELVAEILLADAAAIPPLRTLHFYNNMSGSGGAIAVSKIIAACNLLRDFRFSATRSSADGCLAIAQALGAINNLERLDLSDNSFGAAAAAELGKSLTNHTTLQHINLRDDGLTGDGVAKIFGTLSKTSFPALEFLDLSGNDIEPENLSQLTKWLVKRASSIQSLLLDDNDLGNNGAVKLSKQLESLQHLRHLSCNTCEISNRGALALARAVAKIPSFQKLDINGNKLSASTLEQVTALLEGAGKTLGDMDDNDDEDEDDEDEEEADDSDADSESDAGEETAAASAADGDADDLADQLKAAHL